MDKDEFKEKLKKNFFKAAWLPARVMPLWTEALALGTFIAIELERKPELKERFAEIAGKLFCFEATDLSKKFYMETTVNGIRVIPHSEIEPDVVMRGEMETLVGVLLGSEDPDTVFFSRRLEINGDTSVALHFKNILNSI